MIMLTTTTANHERGRVSTGGNAIVSVWIIPTLLHLANTFERLCAAARMDHWICHYSGGDAACFQITWGSLVKYLVRLNCWTL